MTAVRAATDTERCPCGEPLDPAVFHDDDHHGHQQCEGCCSTCTTDHDDDQETSE